MIGIVLVGVVVMCYWICGCIVGVFFDVYVIMLDDVIVFSFCFGIESWLFVWMFVIGVVC